MACGWRVASGFTTNRTLITAGRDKCCVVPNSSRRYSVLYCFFVIRHERRRILQVNVTKHPISAWIIQQLREAFPFEASHKYLILDRDQKFGFEVMQR